MKYLFSVMLITFSLNSMSQFFIDTVPTFPKDSAIWLFISRTIPDNYQQILQENKTKIIGDTLISGKRYSQVYNTKSMEFKKLPEDSFHAYLRFSGDSILVKYPQNKYVDTLEHLLYFFPNHDTAVYYNTVSKYGDSLLVRVQPESRVFGFSRQRTWFISILQKDSSAYGAECNGLIFVQNIGYEYGLFYNEFDFSKCSTESPLLAEKQGNVYFYRSLRSMTYLKDELQYCFGPLGFLCVWVLGAELKTNEVVKDKLTKVEYYNLNGQLVRHNSGVPLATGIYIQKSTYDSGRITFNKFFKD